MADQSRIQSFRTAPEPDVGARVNGHRWNGHGGPEHRASTGELVSQAANQISTLVRSELALGKAELLEKGRKVGLGGGLLAAALLLSLYGLGLLLALYVVLLDRAWPLWLAVLVPLLTVGALTLALAGLGARKLRAGPPVPSQAANGIRDDIASVRHAFHEGRNHR